MSTHPPLAGVTTIGLDCDDTLWHSEDRFQATHRRFHDLLADHVDLGTEELEARMLATEQANLGLFGYGAKGFTLSLIETAIEVTDGAIPARDIATIVDFGKDLLAHPVELLDGVTETVDALLGRGLRVVLVTKGDLWHQEAKVAASGLADRVHGVEIVSEKDEATYRAVLDRHGVEPAAFCMVGNSVRSDVLPVLGIGGRAVHVPYRYLWAHEAVDEPEADFPVLGSLPELLDLLPPPPVG